MPNEQHYRRLERTYAAAPVTRFFGSSLSVREKEATVTLPLRQEFFHGLGAAHGAVLFRLLDDAAFFAANSVIEDTFVLTVTFHVHFLRPVSSGTLTAVGKLVHASSRLLTAEAVVHSEEGKEIARGSGTFMRSNVVLS